MRYIIVALLFSLPLFSQEKKEINNWADTGITIDIIIEKFLNDKTCKSAPGNYLACVHAYNQILLRQNKKAELFLPDDKDKENNYKIVDTYKILEDVKVVALKQKKLVHFQNNSINRWLEYINKNGMEKLPNIEKQVLEFKEKNVKDSYTDAFYASTLLNGLIPFANHDHSQAVLEKPFVFAGNNRSEIKSLGGTLNALSDGAVISDIIDDSPLHRVGIRPFDKILSVNEITPIDNPIDPIMEVMRADGPIKLLIKRGDNFLDFVVEKDILKEVDVSSTVLAREVGYIRIKTFFRNNISDQVQAVITELKDKKVKSLIIDLRGNGGGFVDHVHKIGGFFLGKDKVIAKIYNKFTKKISEFLTTEEKLTDLPLVILIDGQSASASEILSLGLADHNRATLVGQRSFGKATGQELIENAPMLNSLEGVALKLTSRRFHGPMENSHQLIGITPHFVVSSGHEELDVEMVREENIAIRPMEPTSRKISFTVEQPLINCLNKTSKAHKEYLERETYNSGDLQLLVAKDVAHCL